VRDPQFAAQEELRLPAVSLAVKPQLARDRRPVTGAHELEQRLTRPQSPPADVVVVADFAE
jgi:hypothetical protein